MFKKLFEYRKHNPFEMIEDEEERKKIVKKFLDENYYKINYLFICTVCISLALIANILLFKIFIPQSILLVAVKNPYSWEYLLMMSSSLCCLAPIMMFFMYFSDKCVTLRMYAEEIYEKHANN